MVLVSFLPAYAYTVLSRDAQNLDQTLSDQSQQLYAFPEKILITQIRSDATDIDSDPSSWMDLLYYYSITRLGFHDIPYNYVIDREGNIYQGRDGWEGVVPELAETEGVVLVGYLSNGSDLPLPSKQSLLGLVQTLSYKYGINRDSIEVVDLEISSAGDSAPSKLVYSKAGSVLQTQMTPLLSAISYSDTDHLDYKASVDSIEYDKTAKVGDKINVKLNIKNEGDTPWFTFNDFIYLKTKNGKDSSFAVNGVWDSFDTPLHIEGKTILPGESTPITFDLQALLLPGKYTQSFIFSRLGKKELSNTQFSVGFEIEQGDLKLVKILDTETGALNVRSEPGYNTKQVSEVASGEIYITTAQKDGWYKIKYSNTKEGWIFGKYVKEL